MGRALYLCDVICVVGEQPTPAAKDRDPRKFFHFRLHCLHCGAAEHSFGNCKFHIRNECAHRNQVYVLCGCCGTVFNSTRSLSLHLNVLGLHRRQSSIPGYSPDTLFLPPQSPAPAQIGPVTLSDPVSASSPMSVYSTAPAASVPVITVLDSSVINAVVSSVPASTSSTTTVSASAATSAVVTPVCASTSSDTAASVSRENAELYTQLNLRTLQLIWLASWLVRFPLQSTPASDGVDQMFRRIFVHSWPADLANAADMPLHALVQRLLTYYASLVSQPPLD